MKIAIVGGGLTGLSAAYQAQQDGAEFHLFEATDRLGGSVQTEISEDQTVLEAGAESCLSSKPEMLELVRELGLEADVVSTVPENLGSYIVRDGVLHPIPKGLRLMAPARWTPFLRSGLLSWRGKLRALLDLMLPVPDSALGLPEESLAEFVSRRLGVEVLHYLAQPMVAGIYGADPQLLSLDATMPLFPRLEQEHGSVIRGLRHMDSEQDATGARYSLFFSLQGGFGQVVEELAGRLPTGSVSLGARVDSLELCAPDSELSGWKVGVRGRPLQEFDAVVLALPAPAAAPLLKATCSPMAHNLQQVTYRPAVTVNLSYPSEVYDSAVPQAYGFVVPAIEERPLLACTFSSRKWPGRGSAERGVLRTYFGGPHMGWAANASDQELVAISCSQLEDLLGLEEPPSDFSVHRFPLGLPEYRLGHRQRVQELRILLEGYPSLGLAGNYLDGVGLPDCVRTGRKAVRALLNSV